MSGNSWSVRWGEKFPEWFSLGFEPAVGPEGVPHLVLNMAPVPLRRLMERLRVPTVNQRLLAMFAGSNTKFTLLTDIDKPFGIEGVVVPEQQFDLDQSGLARYTIAIPRIEQDVGPCKECDGTGKEDYRDCSYCHGSARAIKHDFEGVGAVGASLAILSFGLFDFADKTFFEGVQLKREQLLSLKLGRPHIGARLSEDFSSYLRIILTDQQLPLVTEAMMNVWAQMYPSWNTDRYHFPAHVREKGQFTADVPGNASGIYVERSSVSSSGQFEIACHNVDTQAQQLALLCGLATLCEMAREELYSPVSA